MKHPALVEVLKDDGYIPSHYLGSLTKRYPWLLVGVIDSRNDEIMGCELKDLREVLQERNIMHFRVCILWGLRNLLLAQLGLPHPQSRQELEGLN